MKILTLKLRQTGMANYLISCKALQMSNVLVELLAKSEGLTQYFME